jgi:hypothetical protein
MRAVFLSAISFFLVGSLTASAGHMQFAYNEANYFEKGTTAIYPSFSRNPEKKDHNKRKAIIGLVACISLGPVGYLGVRLFSHKNVLVLKYAKLGLMIWIALVVIAGLILLIAKSNGSGNTWQGANFDVTSGMNNKKRKTEQINPQQSVKKKFRVYSFY